VPELNNFALLSIRQDEGNKFRKTVINSKRSKALHLFLTIACNHSASHRPEHLPFSRLHIEGRDADQSRAQSGTSPISPLPDRAYRKPIGPQRPSYGMALTIRQEISLKNLSDFRLKKPN
jgi:hypothetical protein